MISGAELLATLKRYDTATERELAIVCGYSKVAANGRTRLLLKDFYRAVVKAKGLLPDTPACGRKVSGVTKVHFNGNLMIGKAYTRRLGLQPGDAFQIDLTSRDQIKLIRLKPVDQAGDNSEAVDLDDVPVCPAPSHGDIGLAAVA